MSEYKTLDQWFEGKDRGDGRKFTRADWVNAAWFFEPFFKCSHGFWHGVDNENINRTYGLNSSIDWCEWHPPKVKKKIKMYKAVFKGKGEDSDKYWSDTNHYESKTFTLSQKTFGEVVGWIEIEVLVDE